MKKETKLPKDLSFLSDVREFQEFRIGMTTSEIKGLISRNHLIIKGEDEHAIVVMNKNGEVLGISIVDGVSAGIERLQKQPVLK